MPEARTDRIVRLRRILTKGNPLDCRLWKLGFYLAPRVPYCRMLPRTIEALERRGKTEILGKYYRWAELSELERRLKAELEELLKEEDNVNK